MFEEMFVVYTKQYQLLTVDVTQSFYKANPESNRRADGLTEEQQKENTSEFVALKIVLRTKQWQTY